MDSRVLRRRVCRYASAAGNAVGTVQAVVAVVKSRGFMHAWSVLWIITIASTAWFFGPGPWAMALIASVWAAVMAVAAGEAE